MYTFLSYVWVGDAIMYLLMLLATFMSAIYGYNLSARPDYDRDIPRKKAMAILYRFNMQHNYATKLAYKIYRNEEEGLVPSHMQPQDLLYADDSDSEDVTMVYNGLYDDEHSYTLGGDNPDLPLMELGRRLYPSNEMVTKIICVDKSLSCLDGDGEDSDGLEFICKSAMNIDEPFKKVEYCESDIDSTGGFATNSCCRKAGVKRYIASYKVVDARWIDRQSGQLNFDFWRALEERPYSENMGIITKESNGKWLFRGKMNFTPSYEKAKVSWSYNHSSDEDFPLSEKVRTSWELPDAIFDANFFNDKNGNKICDDGCVFKIKGF